MAQFRVMITDTFITVTADTGVEAKCRALKIFKNSLMLEDLIAWEEEEKKPDEPQ